MGGRVVAGIVLALVVGAAAVDGWSKVHTGHARCVVPRLSAAVRHGGDLAVARYHRQRRREFAHDLMGYRDGPPLRPPSHGERKRIRDIRSTREQFGLNASTLLIRRLMRDRAHRDRGFGLLGIALTPLEIQTVRFEDRVQDSIAPLDAYAAHCAADEFGGAYFFNRRAGGYVGAIFTAHLGHHVKALRARLRYGALLRVRRGRYTLRQLNAVQRRVNRDWDSGELARQGLDVQSTGRDDQANRVEVGLSNPSPHAAQVLLQRYGYAVRMNPEPEHVGPA
ncbi:MAG: hypothetical protein QOK25_1255 [Thermoleophilaceae bacterium]|jgi:hypothetical protein|nr:hypothetical protein [Thermoleophilaceae bacterium]